MIVYINNNLAKIRPWTDFNVRYLCIASNRLVLNYFLKRYIQLSI